ncbi:MAG TPA: glycosyltransferase family 4 protein [Cyclobacteriaceae bacterium]
MARRIGIFCDSYRPENKAVAVRLYHLAEAFARHDYAVTVVTATRFTEPSPVRVRRIVTIAPSNLQSNIVRLLSEVIMGMEFFVRILFSRYHIVLLSSPPFLSMAFGAFACKLRGIPYVFDVRDEYPEVYFTAGLLSPTSIIGRILLSIERAIYNNALLVTSVTQGICTRIGKKSMKATVKLVRNGYDGQKFFPASDLYPNFTVVFHGNMGRFQDPDLILKLASKAHEEKRNIEFLIIGWGNNDILLSEQALPNVRYLGMVHYDAIPDAIAHAHLGISFRTDDLISRNAFPVKLYEYIGVGVPALITPRSEAGEFFESKQIGYQFNPDEWQEIYSKIVYLADHPDDLSKLRKNILEERKAFSRTEISDDLVRTVTSLLDNRRNS